MVDVQPTATFLPTGSSQLETDEDSNLFKTTLGDRHSSYNTASINADMLDGHGEDNSDALQAIPPKLLSHPVRPSASPTCTTHLDDQDKENQGNHSSYDTTSVDTEMLDALPTAGNLNTGLINVLDDVAVTPCLTPPTERHTSTTPSEISSTWNLSPVHDSTYIRSGSSPPPTQYLQAFNQLDSRYGGNSEHGLNNLNQIIELSDHFLRIDAVSFIQSLRYRCGQSGLWYRPPLSNPMIGSLAERKLKSLHCAETTEEDTIVGPVRLRMARIFLYHYMEQKVLDIRTNRSMPNLRSRGKDVPSIVIDLTLDDIYGCNNESVSLLVRKRRRESLKTHMGMGKRWSFLAAHLGIGILLTCDPSLESFM
jgi:hypothetical protein